MQYTCDQTRLSNYEVGALDRPLDRNTKCTFSNGGLNLNTNKAIHSNINRTSTKQRLNVDKTRDNGTNKQSIRQVKQKKQQQPKHL